MSVVPRSSAPLGQDALTVVMLWLGYPDLRTWYMREVRLRMERVRRRIEAAMLESERVALQSMQAQYRHSEVMQGQAHVELMEFMRVGQRFGREMPEGRINEMMFHRTVRRVVLNAFHTLPLDVPVHGEVIRTWPWLVRFSTWPPRWA